MTSALRLMFTVTGSVEADWACDRLMEKTRPNVKMARRDNFFFIFVVLSFNDECLLRQQIVINVSFVHIVQYFSRMKAFLQYLILLLFLVAALPAMSQTKKPVGSKNTAPEIRSLTLDGKAAGSRIKLNPQEKYIVNFGLFDLEGDKLTLRWELFPVMAAESTSKPLAIADSISPVAQERVMLHVPMEEGEYILWLYVSDGKGNTTKSNIKFTVLPN